MVIPFGLLCAVLAATAAPAATVESLAWMAGCWEGRRGDRVIEEQWMAPRGGTMLGMGRTTVRDTTREFEAVRIDVQDGRLTYTADPSGQSRASFREIEHSERHVTFENPSHDFPQRITYRAVGVDSLIARIEGERGGRLRAVEFAYRRVACAGGH